MNAIGQAARHLRELEGISQREAASKLGITPVHLCNVELGKANPSSDLLGSIRELYGVDVHVLAWCLFGRTEQLPPRIQRAADALASAWKRELYSVIATHESE